MITEGFLKLIDRGHIIPWENLSEDQRIKIKENPSHYFLPWDVSFKQGSTSTPCRCVFDGSSRTPGGTSLNEILAKGNADLASLLEMVLAWVIGPVACCSDISQFYNSVLLDDKHWPYQQVIWFNNLDTTSKLHRGIIRTCIYGITCVGAQTEYVMNLIADEVEDHHPEVAKLLRRRRYVDDFGTSCSTENEIKHLIHNTETTLNEKKMSVKGWAVSGNAPPEKLSENNITVPFAGLQWLPEVDAYKLNISSLHFGKKKRGRLPDDLIKYEGTFGKTIDDFTPQNLSRRMCSSVTARKYDILGKAAPLDLRLKNDLRKLILVDNDWDKPISKELRSKWVENFTILEDIRDIIYVRSSIPDDALRTSVRLWLLCDGAEDGMMITCHLGHERKNGLWSCHHLIAKNLLPPTGWSIPQIELHVLNALSNLAAFL